MKRIENSWKRKDANCIKNSKLRRTNLGPKTAAALAIAVSLWLAGGGAALAGGNLYIDRDDGNTLRREGDQLPSGATVSPAIGSSTTTIANTVAAEPPVRNCESHQSGQTGATFLKLDYLFSFSWIQPIEFPHRDVFCRIFTDNIDLICSMLDTIHNGIRQRTVIRA